MRDQYGENGGEGCRGMILLCGEDGPATLQGSGTLNSVFRYQFIIENYLNVLVDVAI